MLFAPILNNNNNNNNNNKERKFKKWLKSYICMHYFKLMVSLLPLLPILDLFPSLQINEGVTCTFTTFYLFIIIIIFFFWETHIHNIVCWFGGILVRLLQTLLIMCKDVFRFTKWSYLKESMVVWVINFWKLGWIWSLVLGTWKWTIMCFWFYNSMGPFELNLLLLKLKTENTVAK